MTRSIGVVISRRKAVWGPKRTLAAFVLIAVGVASSAFAEGHHNRAARQAQAGQPNSHVRNYKIDGELTRRAGTALPNHKSKVIVELVVDPSVWPDVNGDCPAHTGCLTSEESLRSAQTAGKIFGGDIQTNFFLFFSADQFHSGH